METDTEKIKEGSVKRILIIIGSIAVLIALVCIVFFWQQNRQQTIPAEIAPSITISPPSTSIPTQRQLEANIRIRSPKPNNVVSLPIIITGEARVFENQLRHRLIECDGRTLHEGIMTAQSPDIGLYGSFRTEITSIPNIQGKNGCIEVFSDSPKDGSEINMVTLPITFDFTNTLVVKAFFGGKQAPEGAECTTVYPVERRIVKSQSTARAALEELLKGPMIFEKNNGYFTNINPNVKIQKLTIMNGVARADFDIRLEEGVGGSCKVTAIRLQINQTLKQFPTVKEVIISIDGRTEDILQP